MHRRILAVTSLIALSGCAVNSEYATSLDSWVGASADDFIAEHRAPDSTIDTFSHRIYVWDRMGTSRAAPTCTTPIEIGGGVVSQQVCFHAGTATRAARSQCAWELRVDQDNVVIATELLGGACDAEERPVSRPVMSASS